MVKPIHKNALVKNHYDLLDIGRFLAAFAVVMYHFTFEGWTEKHWHLEYGFGDFWKYGYLGVQFFFIISGFVVFMSAKNKTLSVFFASRIARLFPAYWVCVFSTFFLLWLILGYHFSFYYLLINLTMLQGFVKVPHIDPVYWSLTYELIFYFWVAIYLFFKCSEKNLPIFLSFFLFLSSSSYFFTLPNIVIIVFQTVYAPYFVAGICLYRLSERHNRYDIFLLFWCYIISIGQIYTQLVELSNIRSVEFSIFIPALLISLIYLFFVALSFGALPIKVKWASGLGALTYPLYLIHMEIGAAIFSRFGSLDNKYYLLASLIFMFILFSYVVVRCVEKVFSKKLKICILSVLR